MITRAGLVLSPDASLNPSRDCLSNRDVSVGLKPSPRKVLELTKPARETHGLHGMLKIYTQD